VELSLRSHQVPSRKLKLPAERDRTRPPAGSLIAQSFRRPNVSVSQGRARQVPDWNITISSTVANPQVRDVRRP
jgi:hypothetical protein